MIRRYGWATPGQRVVDDVPDNYGVTYTRLAALGLDGLQAPWVVDGAVHGDIFRWGGRDILGPTLRPGDIGLVFSLSSKAINNTASDLVSCAGWVAVVIMGCLLHGGRVSCCTGDGKEAYQQRPVEEINRQA
jgi:hypothetical protein